MCCGLCLFLLYWIVRIWMLTTRGQMPEDSVAFSTSDPASFLVLGLLSRPTDAPRNWNTGSLSPSVDSRQTEAMQEKMLSNQGSAGRGETGQRLRRCARSSIREHNGRGVSSVHH
jgi:hypothetical protein